jgi:chemotaxis response regulator CheB
MPKAAHELGAVQQQVPLNAVPQAILAGLQMLNRSAVPR